MSAAQKVFKDTIPLWLAVAITVFVSMPFGLWLGKYNFTLWCGFIVWAEYFALGAKPAGIKLIVPSFCYAAALTALTLFVVQFFSFVPSLLVPGDLAVSLVVAAGVGLMVWTMKFSKTFQEGSLPFFNGISMALAIYFSGSYPKLGPDMTLALVSGVWTILMCLFGVGLGVFNVWILFPKEVKS
jgi:hypothetical protein